MALSARQGTPLAVIDLRTTQAELAEAASLDPRTIQRLEAGAIVGLSSVVAVATALGTAVAALFRAVRTPKRRAGRPRQR